MSLWDANAIIMGSIKNIPAIGYFILQPDTFCTNVLINTAAGLGKSLSRDDATELIPMLRMQLQAIRDA